MARAERRFVGETPVNIGPSTFESLTQGSLARARQIEAAREAALTNKLESIIPEVSEIPDMSRRILDKGVLERVEPRKFPVIDFFGFLNRFVPQRLRRPAMVTFAVGGVGLLIACSGGGGNNGEVNGTETGTGTPFGSPANTGGSGESPKPTAVSSTAKPPEPTPTATATPEATAEQLPSHGEVFDLIVQGLNETGLTPYQVPDVDATNPESIQFFVSNCRNDRQPITPKGAPQEYGPDDPTYGLRVSTECSRVASITVKLFDASGSQKFVEANKKWMRIHKAIFDDLSRDYPDMMQHWPSIVSHYYSIGN